MSEGVIWGMPGRLETRSIYHVFIGPLTGGNVALSLDPGILRVTWSESNNIQVFQDLLFCELLLSQSFYAPPCEGPASSI
jgi:hypothetical protein